MIQHIEIGTSGAALERFARGLLLTGASLLSSRVTPARLGRGYVALLVVDIPEGMVEHFRHVVQPLVMRDPPRVCV